MKTKLHELLAVETDRSAAATAIIEETTTTFTKRAEHFFGKHTVYLPFDEQDANQAEEASKEIVTTVAAKLAHCFKIVSKAVDVTASKDATNCLAQAPIMIDGVELTPPLPAVTLLMLETHLKKWLEIMLAIPTLAPGRKWELDAGKGAGIYLDVHPDAKFRTKKVVKHTVLVDPTDHHPAQVRDWTEDERIGKVIETTWCGMLSPADKSAIIGRVQDLLAATKQARQRANCQEVVDVRVADTLAKYILG